MISRSRSALSRVRTRAIASASPVTLHASTTSGWRAQRLGDLVEQRARARRRARRAPRSRAPSAAWSTTAREAAERAARAQPVDAALDRRRADSETCAADVVVRSARVLDQQRKDLAVDVVHAADSCTKTQRTSAAIGAVPFEACASSPASSSTSPTPRRGRSAPRSPAQIQPSHPEDSSYARAAEALRARDFTVAAHTDGPLTAEALARRRRARARPPVRAEVGAHRARRLAASSAPTSSTRSRRSSRAGGGLVVLGEEEQEKYGTTSPSSPRASASRSRTRVVCDYEHHHQRAALGARRPRAGARRSTCSRASSEACFYRATTLAPTGGARVLARASPTSSRAGRAAARRRRARRRPRRRRSPTPTSSATTASTSSTTARCG